MRRLEESESESLRKELELKTPTGPGRSIQPALGESSTLDQHGVDYGFRKLQNPPLTEEHIDGFANIAKVQDTIERPFLIVSGLDASHLKDLKHT